MEAVRTVTCAEEDLKERKRLRGGGPSGVTRGEKKKFEDSRPPLAVKRVKKPYLAEEKANYKARKAEERKVKKEGSVAPAGEVRYILWVEAHQGVDQKVVHKGKKDNKCARYGMKNHAWKYS